MWVDGDAAYEAPTDETDPMLLSPDLYDSEGSTWVSAGLGGANLSSGTTGGFADETSTAVYDIGNDFEVGGEFDPTWHL